MPQLTFNPGLTLTGFPTTLPWLQFFKRYAPDNTLYKEKLSVVWFLNTYPLDIWKI